MPKTTVFELKATLKSGKDVHMKGTRFTEDNLPDYLRDEVNSGSNTIEIISFGDDFESAEFEPEKTITIKEPKKKLFKKKTLKQ